MTKERLEKLLIVDKLSYEAIGRLEGVTGAAIKKRAKKFGLHQPKIAYNGHNKTPHNQKDKKHCPICQTQVPQRSTFCSQKCWWEHTYKEYIKEWKKGNRDGKSGQFSISKHIRRYLFEKHDSKCDKCGWSEVNPMTQKIPLQINHIDGDYTNNRESNLELLCPNCHSLTETFGILNKGNGRYNRSGTKHPQYT